MTLVTRRSMSERVVFNAHDQRIFTTGERRMLHRNTVANASQHPLNNVTDAAMANVTDAAGRCINDAGEHIVTARDGGYAVYVDSGTLGKPGTGGNFGLVVLGPDQNGTVRS